MNRGVVRALAVLCVALSAGCLAAPPAHETLIRDIAPLPTAPPGVILSWSPPADPVTLAADTCDRFPFHLTSMGASGVELDLTLELDGNLPEGLDGKITPSRVTLREDERVDGELSICAPSDAPASAGRLYLVASAGTSTVALASMALETTQKS